MEITPELIKDCLGNCGFYLGCVGCDLDAKEGISPICNQDSMAKDLSDYINLMLGNVDELGQNKI